MGSLGRDEARTSITLHTIPHGLRPLLAEGVEARTDSGSQSAARPSMAEAQLRHAASHRLPLVKDFTLTALDHVPKQAQTLTPGDFVNVLALTRQGCGPQVIPAKLIALACIACVRCKHLARSTLQCRTPNMLSAFCSKGKAVRRGTRPPYTWALPLMPEMQEDCFDFLVNMLERWHRPPFLVPAFKAVTTKRKFTTRRWQQQTCATGIWCCY